jgi:hypothetical protein
VEWFKRAARAAVGACAVGALVACGGGGDSGSSSGSGSGSSGGSSGGTGGSASPYLLFASDYTGDLAAFTTLSPAAGTTITANVVETVQYTGKTMAYDAGHDELYTLFDNTFVDPSAKLIVYGHASTLKAGAAAARTLVLADFWAADEMVLDVAHDRLWVLGSDRNSQGLVEVFEQISTLAGTPTASRVIHASSYNIAVDVGRDILYLNQLGNEISVYMNASTLSGSILADRQMRGMDSTDGMVLDASRDTLYTIGTGGASIGVIHNASTATTVTQAAIALPAGAQLMGLAVDSAHDRLYAGGQDAAYVIDNVSTLTSGTAPAAKVQATGALVSAFAFAGQ